MLMQTLSGVAQDLDADSAGGTITATPAHYPQSVEGVLISSAPVVAVIDEESGAFTIDLPKTAHILLTAKDLRGKTYFSQIIVISNDDSVSITQYLPTNPAGGLTPAVIEGGVVVMQQRRHTAAEWAEENPVLANGQIGLAADTGVFKIGNGVAVWSSLATEYGPGAGGGSCEDGAGIVSILLTGSVGLVDTYTITLDDLTTYTFDVTNGADSFVPGPPGPSGIDGDSAYDIAVLNGFVGTEVEWLASLEGDVGLPGPPGATEASGVSFTPAGTLLATDVQAAIVELDAEKQSKITISTLEPSGGVDGDIWFKYTV